MKKFITLLLSFSMIFVIFDNEVVAQRKSKRSKPTAGQAPAATHASARSEGYAKRRQMLEISVVKNVAFRSAGPSIMSGRVTDIDANPDDPSIFYVSYASGGLWKTVSNGADFTPLFDNEMTMTIGDIAVDWKHGETLWVGTGENNSSRSSYSGSGIYKSKDQGETWEHLGLEESHHIGRIIVHPENPDIVWVAALGHLYSTNPERGVYKTTDGGKTWTITLFINAATGIIDLVMDPQNPEVLYAAAWERIRHAWTFTGSGKGSGIYKSTDGGSTWIKLTTEESGFPVTEGVGRIGLAVAATNPQTVYAILDNQDRREKKEEKEDELVTKDKLRSITREDFLKITNENLQKFLRDNRFPEKYTAKSVKAMVKSGKIQPVALVEYLENANSLLFDTPVKGAEVYRSDDGGKSWHRTHEDYIDRFYFSYGYYFGEIRLDEQNPEKIYILGVPLLLSDDGGKTWNNINGSNQHGDHQALWLNPRRSGHFINGNDGGINISYDDGKSYYKCNSIPVGQFYTVNVDMAKPYNIYGGLQDNGVWFGPHNYQHSNRWHASGQYPYKMIYGGDGMQVAIDTRDNQTVYTGSQFGFYARINTKTGERKSITPRHDLGERPYRWNWQSPIMVSHHNQDIVYFGSNYFHRSMDQGNTFEKLSGDLTKGGKKGNVPYGTLTTITESPLKFGLLYVGSDDGLIHVSKDAGYTWSLISGTLPADFWVSRVEASRHSEGRIYASLNGYRWDNYEALVYVSENYGKTWKRIGLDLPAEPVNVIREDPENENVIYVGTDHGVYVSLDRSATFTAMDGGLPAAPVHDLVIHPREHDLVLGTHGRSFWVADVQHIQALNTEILAKDLHVFSIDTLSHSPRWGTRSFSGGFFEPSVNVAFYAGTGGETGITIITQEGLVLNSFKHASDRGLNYASYDLTVEESIVSSYQEEINKKVKEKEKEKVTVEKADNDKYYLQPGKYTVEISIGETTLSEELEVKKPQRRPGR